MDPFVPFLYALGTSLPLIIGAVVGVVWRLPTRLIAALLAFASGSLLTGLAFELFEPAFETAGPILTTASLMVGTIVYVSVKHLADGRGGGSGVPLLAAVVFDGLAENITLGVTLIGTPTVGPLAILLGIAANNLPEAVAGATSMTESGRSAAWTLGVWTATAIGLGATVLVGRFGFATVGATKLALIRATGGGAVLASLAIEIMPDAYEGGGPTVAVATAGGFAVTFVLV